MLSHKTKNLKSKKSKRLTTAKKVNNKKSLKAKKCHYSSHSSSSSFNSSSSSSSSSYCTSSCWSGFSSSSSYKSCSVSSSNCDSSSCSDGSCGNQKRKTLVLGNKYLNIGNDTLTLKFDPSKCNTLSAPIYEMGFGLSNIVSGTSVNNVLLLGLNQTTAPYINVTPRLAGTSYIAPYVSIDLPAVNTTSAVIDDNSFSTISNKQLKFIGNDAWITLTDTFNLSTTLTALGYHTIGTYSNITNSIAFGPESLNYSCSLFSATNDILIADFRNLVINVHNNVSPTTINLTDSNVGLNMLKHGDIRYINFLNTHASTAVTLAFTPSSYSFGGNSYNITVPTAPISVNGNKSIQLKLTTIYVPSLNTYYINIQ